jgi:hypothetical protein
MPQASELGSACANSARQLLKRLERKQTMCRPCTDQTTGWDFFEFSASVAPRLFQFFQEKRIDKWTNCFKNDKNGRFLKKHVSKICSAHRCSLRLGVPGFSSAWGNVSPACSAMAW